MGSVEDAAGVLRAFRDALRTPLSTDAFTAHLHAASAALFPLETSSAPSSSTRPVSLASPSAAALLSAIDKHLPSLQTLLLTTAVPTFRVALDAADRAALVALFVPPAAAPAAAAVARATYLVLPPLLKTLPLPSRPFALELAARLVHYGIDDLHRATFASAASRDARAAELGWSDVARATTSLPAKVANAAGEWGLANPVDARAYFADYARRLARLCAEVGSARADPAPVRLVLERLHALGLFGARPDEQRLPAFFPSFLPPLLRHLRAASNRDGGETILPSLVLPLPLAALNAFVAGLITHLAHHLRPSNRPDPDVRRAARVLTELVGAPDVGGEAWTAVLLTLAGRRRDTSEAQQTRARIVLAWAAQGGEDGQLHIVYIVTLADIPACKAILDTLLDAWTDAPGIRHSVFSERYTMTYALIGALSLLLPYSAHLSALARRARFLHAVQAHLGHPDPRVRRLGMLVAELVSELTITDDGSEGAADDKAAEIEALKAGLEVDEATGERKRKAPRPSDGVRRLRFGKDMWDGDGDGREECRALRAVLGVRDSDAALKPGAADDAWLLGWDAAGPLPPPPPIQPEPRQPAAPAPSEPASREPGRSRPKIVMLDADQLADPLTGYGSPPGSPRSEPDDALLAEVRADPSLALDAAQRRRVRRPVYMGELVQLLKRGDKPDEVEVALAHGEALVRAKRSFGTELAEHAHELARYAIGLSDTAKLDAFEARRQGLVTALVACAPRNVPPFLAEQYFSPQYSLHQRAVMLTALAMGARELAGLPAAPTRTRAIDFPSKMLPPKLHARYAAAAAPLLEDAAASVRGAILSTTAKKGEATVPALQRERRLRVGPGGRAAGSQTLVAEVDSADATAVRQKTARMAAGAGAAPPGQPVIPFRDVAAEYFVLPLVNRFWQQLEDATTRIAPPGARPGGSYRGAGTGAVLEPSSLEKLLLTLAVLVHAARHAAVFLAVICPDALELAVTVGARFPTAPTLGITFDTGATMADDAGAAAAAPPPPEAQVLGAALELALVSLDAAIELDAGRTLAIDKPQLVLAAGEWAHGVFEAEGKGSRAAGTRTEGRLTAAAAGVVVKVAEIGEKWRMTM